MEVLTSKKPNIGPKMKADEKKLSVGKGKEPKQKMRKNMLLGYQPYNADIVHRLSILRFPGRARTRRFLTTIYVYSPRTTTCTHARTHTCTRKGLPHALARVVQPELLFHTHTHTTNFS